MISVVDYGAGNLQSVQTALDYLGQKYLVSDRPQKISQGDRLIFPGVGEARAAMTVLRQKGLDEAIVKFVRQGKPILGICIGCQVALSFSEERDTPCLDLIAGRVRRFRLDRPYKVPHMGWNQVRRRRSHPLFQKIPDETSFYFVHSYYPDPDDQELVVGETDYGVTFASAVVRDNLFIVQFHPEKSGPAGLTLLTNFTRWNP